MFTVKELVDGCKKTSHLLKPPKTWGEAFNAIGRDATPRDDQESHAQAYLDQLGDDIQSCVRTQPNCGTAAALLLTYIRYLYTSENADFFKNDRDTSAATRQDRADAVDDLLAVRFPKASHPPESDLSDLQGLPIDVFVAAIVQLAAVRSLSASGSGELAR